MRRRLFDVQYFLAQNVRIVRERLRNEGIGAEENEHDMVLETGNGLPYEHIDQNVGCVHDFVKTVGEDRV